MNILSIIEKKKNNKKLTEQEIVFFINNYVNNNEIKDYQAAALLMAICINGMSINEIYWLTKAMLNSGNIIDTSNIKGIIIDKHSSGGVGDKVSLILGPIVASLGIKISKISGKGLGHTGGTIDKLESVGVKTKLSKQEYRKLLAKNNIFIMSQTEDIVPADKKLYELRDATCTVNSLPLIASSIISKKLASGANYLFLDVKYGDGALCKTLKEAEELSKLMITLYKKFKSNIVITISSMEQPLGRSIGNALEIKAAINFLNGNYESNDEKKLIYAFITTVLLTTKYAKTKEEAYKKIDDVISTKKALNKFYEWIKSQNGNINLLKQNNYFKPRYSMKIKAPKTGYLQYLSSSKIGLISCSLGAGRINKEDTIDFHAGIYLNKITNEFVEKNETIATLYSSKLISHNIAKEFLNNCKINKQRIKLKPLIAKIIK